MHSWFVWSVAFIGMGGCMWMLDDLWRFFYLECVCKVHTIAIERIVQSHIRLINKCCEIDVCVDELAETVIEVMGPFID